jgi:hypothetical protein
MPDDIYANNVRVSYNMLVAFYGANLLKYNSYSRFKDFELNRLRGSFYQFKYLA